MVACKLMHALVEHARSTACKFIRVHRHTRTHTTLLVYLVLLYEYNLLTNTCTTHSFNRTLSALAKRAMEVRKLHGNVVQWRWC